MLNKTVNIGSRPMCYERFKTIFFDPCPKERIPELLSWLPARDREAFETRLKAEADMLAIARANGLTPITYDPHPCNATVLVFFENEQTATWSAHVTATGQIEAFVDNHGNRYTSMEALHDHKITHFTLEFEYSVGVPISKESDE